MSLSLSLLGPFHALWEGRPLTFPTGATRALLTYLAVEADRPQPREALASLLWPDHPTATAFSNLRQTLFRLRKSLPPAALAALHVTPQAVELRSAAVLVDVVDFERLLAECAAHDHVDLAACRICVARLEQAAALYRGEFLRDLSLVDSQPFQEWALFRREQLHGQALAALDSLAQASERRADYAAARRWAERQLALEPWRETAHAQLMRALAHDGQRAAALAQFETCRRVLAQELGIEPGVEINALAARIQAGGLSPASLTTPLPRHNLPAQLTPFVGREGELATVRGLLQAPETRLLTIVGAGGMGKTRLALEAALAQVDRFPDGVFLVPLAPLTSAADLAPTIASTLGLVVQGAPEPAVIQALHARRTLLILDNFEHLLDGARLVADLLQAAPDVRVLVTARERLNVRGEHVYTLHGMDFGAGVGEGTHAGQSAAVQLFAQAARRASAGFAVDAATLPDVLRICRLVQGMPLGLEMAAAWVEALSPAEIADEIQRSADFLAYDWRDAPPRQRSMRAVFDWSWGLLSEGERRTLAQLSVFPASFTRAAAQAVAGASLRTLTSLVHKSLLGWSEARDGVGRYEMHDLVCQFAAEQLGITPDEQWAALARHSAFYLDFLAQRERRLDRAEPKETMRELLPEIDHLRQAWEWAVSHQDAEAVDRSAYGLWHFYLVAGLWSEGERALRRATEAFRAADQPALLSKLLGIHAYALHIGGHHDEALVVAQAAHAVATASGSVEGLILGEMLWGVSLLRTGSYREARPRLERALAMSHAHHQDVPGESLWDAEWGCHLFLGMVATLAGDPAQGLASMTQALRLCQTLGKRRGEVTCLYNLGNVARQVRDFGLARSYYEEALRLVPGVGYTWGEGMVQHHLGEALRMQGEYGLADEMLQRAHVTLRDIGAAEAWTALASLSRLHLCMGDTVSAQAWLADLADAADRVQSRDVKTFILLTRALQALQRGDPDQAVVYARQAQAMGAGAGSADPQATSLVVVGHAASAAGQREAAREAYGQAVSLWDVLRATSLAAEAQAGLATVALADGDLPAALSHIEPVLPLLDGRAPVGLDEPFFTYATAYRVLAAGGDSRAGGVLAQGRALLARYAASIPDQAARRRFLQQALRHHALRRPTSRAAAWTWRPTPSSAASSPAPTESPPVARHQL